MEYLGIHNDRKVYWSGYSEDKFNELPDNNWICFAIVNLKPEYNNFEKFVRLSIEKGILEFKTWGDFCDELHDYFDETVAELEVLEGHETIDVMTTWHSKEGIASAFWECFYATCLPDNVNLKDLKIVCVHLENIDMREELKEFLKRFDEGWLPSEEE